MFDKKIQALRNAIQVKHMAEVALDQAKIEFNARDRADQIAAQQLRDARVALLEAISFDAVGKV